MFMVYDKIACLKYSVFAKHDGSYRPLLEE